MNASIFEDLELGFVTHLSLHDPFMELLALVDQERQFSHGWPRQLLAKPAASKVPAVTWERQGVSPTGEVPPFVRIITNIWAWAPDLDAVNAIDLVMLERFGGLEIEQWEDPRSHLWMDCRRVESMDPAGAKFDRRRSVWEVSPR